MRFLTHFAAAAALSALAVGVADARRNRSPEAEYQRLIAGKTPGKPVDCIDTRFDRPSLSAYGDKLIYRVSSKLVYVNDSTGGCQGVARGDVLVTRQFQSRLCKGDIAQTVSVPPAIPTGSCALGSFTPYRAN
ncbi:hypothetical protein [Sphingomonas adhaesiva]|uniref:hypothetical protein n=1 Tax=Sphingomonas adhaesiva TaxID=28212 RepID=UPI002FFCBB7C